MDGLDFVVADFQRRAVGFREGNWDKLDKPYGAHMRNLFYQPSTARRHGGSSSAGRERGSEIAE